MLTITNFAPEGRNLVWSDYEEVIPEGMVGRSILNGRNIVASGEGVVEAYGCEVIEFVK